MAFLITTTGTLSPVTFDDLGARSFTHPTISFDLETEFSIDEIRGSEDVFSAIASGFITATFNAKNVTLATDIDEVRSNDNRLYIDNELRVKKNPGVGEFSSFTDALNSITTNSTTNRFRINGGPGKFIEDTLTMKSYVHIQGSGSEETIIEVDSPSKDVIIGTDDATISDLAITGATDVGRRGIYYSSSNVSQFFVENIRFLANNILAESAASGSGSCTIFTTNIKYGDGHYFDKGFVATNTGSGAGRILLRNASSVSGLYSTLPSVFAIANAPSCEIIMNGVQVRNGGAQGGIALQSENGGILRLSSVNIKGFTKGIYVPAGGAAPVLSIVGLNLENNTDDIVIEHPSATGAIQGNATISKVSIAAVGVSINLQDPDDASLNISKKLNIKFPDGTLTDVSTLIVESGTMGLIEGGELSVAGSPAFTIDVAEGFGYVEIFPDQDYLRRIDWDDTSIVIPVNSERYIYFNNTGVLSLSSALPDTFFNIVLGRVITDSSGIEILDVTPLQAEHTSNRMNTAQRLAVGSIFSSGSIVAENVTPFHLNIGSGRYFFAENQFNPSGGVNINFTSYYQNGSGGWVKTPTNVVDGGFYDNGSGTLQAISHNDYAKHTLYIVGDGANEKYMLVYAQSQWTSLLEAQEATISLPPTYFTEGVVAIAGIIVKEGNPNIVQIRDQRPTVAFRSEGVNAASTHGSLLGLLNDDHPQYLLVSGTRDMSGDLNLGNNKVVNTSNVVIGGLTPTASSAIDIQSTTGALLVSRLTTTERLALTPTNGMIVFDTTLNEFRIYQNSWVPMGSIPNMMAITSLRI